MRDSGLIRGRLQGLPLLVLSFFSDVLWPTTYQAGDLREEGVKNKEVKK